LDVCKTTNFTGLKAIYRFKSMGYGVLFNPETLVFNEFMHIHVRKRTQLRLTPTDVVHENHTVTHHQ
jgi:hypothetical protein